MQASSSTQRTGGASVIEENHNAAGCLLSYCCWASQNILYVPAQRSAA